MFERLEQLQVVCVFLYTITRSWLCISLLRTLPVLLKASGERKRVLSSEMLSIGGCSSCTDHIAPVSAKRSEVAGTSKGLVTEVCRTTSSLTTSPSSSTHLPVLPTVFASTSLQVNGSSLRTVGYGIYGIRRSQRQNVGPFSAVNLPYFALIGVGFFSGLYHMTLKYQTQNGTPTLSKSTQAHYSLPAQETRCPCTPPWLAS